MALIPGLVVALLFTAARIATPQWPQFRGLNASGVSESLGPPDEFGPTANLVWRTPVPPGNSSPSVGADRIFLTAIEKDQLFTIAVDRTTGRILWRREAPRPRKHEIQRPANGPASATPATDGRNAFVFFQDFGLLAYGPDGNELWRLPLGPFNNPFGHGSSPILAGGTLFMLCDQDTDSFLLALDKNTGRVLWRAGRPHAQRGYATPVLYRAAGGALQVIVAGSYRLSGYDAATGREVWWIRRLPWQIKPTPVLDGDVVYFVAYSGESDPGEQEFLPPFAETLVRLDTNKDRRISKDELSDSRMKQRFDEYLDLDHTGFLEERDWEHFQDRRQGENALRAYRLGGQGDLTESGLLWKNARMLPNVPSPLFYRGVLYTLREGGILTSLDPKTGAVLKQGRIQGAIGTYFASPVAAGGKIYTLSDDGKAAVLQAGAEWRVLRVNQLDDGCKATPAIVDGKLYVRTSSALYCFGRKD